MPRTSRTSPKNWKNWTSGKRRIRSAAVVATVAAAGLLGAAVPASAAAASPTAVCGSGYSVIDSHRLATPATVYLLYSGGTGKNCVVTIRDTTGAVDFMEAWVTKTGGKRVIDSGLYTSYAGPVYISAAGTCVQWGGRYGKVEWTSDWGHCG
ncbi:hypothetical protein [Streptomyces scopuliridis]|uniref:hypothetical protein n=1 Tax=Streptomyces scopuliridis TaxID=452529 RepID=UPI0035D597DF